jgi:hypothetical protein
MWALTNRTPYAAERTWLRDRDGNHVWLVVVKATFVFTEEGEVRLDDVQPPPRAVPEYRGEPGLSSLRYEADMVAPKPTTDIVVSATAHAPLGKPVTVLPVQMRVGEVFKGLMVSGERAYVERLRGGVTVSPPLPFTECPIEYEWAWGGTDVRDSDPARHAMAARNPVGKGFAVDAQTLLNTTAHRIDYPGASQSEPRPAGFGAIGQDWSPRRELAGSFDDLWTRTRRPLLPVDYDERFVLCSPEDQRPAKHLRGGEPVELVNLTRGGLVRFTLPRVYPTFATFFGPRRVEHRARLGTVILEPDAMRLQLVFQTALPVPSSDVDYLDTTSVREKRYLA